MEKIDLVIADEDIKESDFSPEELEDDTTDWKAKAQELKGIAKRRATQLAKVKAKLGEAKPEPEPDPSKKEPLQKSGELDYGQLAYLTAKGIEHEDDVALVEKVRKETGKELKDIVVSKYFQAELQELRDVRKNKEASPKGENRGQPNASDDVAMWVAKIEKDEAKLDDISDYATRVKVHEARMKNDGQSPIMKRIAEKQAQK